MKIDLRAQKLNKNDYTVIPIELPSYKELLITKHYLKSIPSISFAFGLYSKGVLKGVCTYGVPFSPGIRNIMRGRVFELNRLVLVDNSPNEASFLVAASLKQLPMNCIVVSFADPSQGHKGTIYQAANFDYYGLSEKKNNMILEEGNGHAMTNGAKIKKDKSLKYHYEERIQKHRYVYIHGTKSFKKLAKQIVSAKYKQQQYPK